MNIAQRRICFWFAIFLLITGLVLLFNNKSLSSIIAIAFSAVGFYFFFGKSAPERKRVRLIQTKAFKIILIIISSIALIFIALGTFLWFDEKTRLESALHAQRIIGQKEQEQIAQEMQNAKQISLVKWDTLAAAFPPYTHYLEFTLKNNSNRVVECVDLLIKYHALDGSPIKRDVITDCTNSELINPNSESKFIKYVKLDIPTQEWKSYMYVYKVKFQPYYYSVVKYKTPIENFPNEYILSEKIDKYVLKEECLDRVASLKADNEVISVDYVEESDEISSVFNDKPISNWYVRTIVKIKNGEIKEWVTIYPDQKFIQRLTDSEQAEEFFQLIQEGAIKSIEKEGAQAKIYSVSPKGKVTWHYKTFE